MTVMKCRVFKIWQVVCLVINNQHEELLKPQIRTNEMNVNTDSDKMKILKF
jgi:hypothetical protein